MALGLFLVASGAVLIGMAALVVANCCGVAKAVHTAYLVASIPTRSLSRSLSQRTVRYFTGSCLLVIGAGWVYVGLTYL